MAIGDTSKLSEQLVLVGTIDPDAYAADSNPSSDEVDMSDFDEIIVVATFGTVEATAAGTVTINSGAASGTHGNAVKVLRTYDATNSDDKQYICSVKGSDLTSGDRYVQVDTDFNTAALDFSLVILGRPKVVPGDGVDLASATIVEV